MWHHSSKGKSIIDEMVALVQANGSRAYLQIYTIDENDFYLFSDDKYVIGEGFIYIQSLDDKNNLTIDIINIEHIVSIYVKVKLKKEEENATD